MAKINASHFGSYQGKIGAVTGFKRLGLYYIRQSIFTNSSRTRAQLLVRSKFTNVNHILKPFHSFMNFSFASAKGNGRTAQNVATSMNFAQVDKLTGELDPSKVICSVGPLPNVINAMVTCPQADQTLKMVWRHDESNPSIVPEDEVWLVAYEPKTNLCVTGKGLVKDETLMLKCPVAWAAHSVHTYVCTHRPNSNVWSPSEYLQNVSVE